MKLTGVTNAVRELLENQPDLSREDAINKLSGYNRNSVKRLYHVFSPRKNSREVKKKKKDQAVWLFDNEPSTNGNGHHKPQNAPIQISLELPAHGSYDVKILEPGTKRMLGTMSISEEGFSWSAPAAKLAQPYLGFERAVKLFTSGLLG